MKEPITIIAIAGGSCSGKTTIANGLVSRLGREAAVFGLDAYYRDARDTPEDAIEVDTPAALDHELLLKQLSVLAAGNSIEQPCYDYSTHARLRRTRHFEPVRHLIVEGLFALYWPELRESAAWRVFVDAPVEECLRRRLERDVRERGRPEQIIHKQFTEKVVPNYHRYVEPTRAFANIEIDGLSPTGESIQTIIDRIRG